jgi:hypothetical protein
LGKTVHANPGEKEAKWFTTMQGGRVFAPAGCIELNHDPAEIVEELLEETWVVLASPPIAIAMLYRARL